MGTEGQTRPVGERAQAGVKKKDPNQNTKALLLHERAKTKKASDRPVRTSGQDGRTKDPTFPVLQKPSLTKTKDQEKGSGPGKGRCFPLGIQRKRGGHYAP